VAIVAAAISFAVGGSAVAPAAVTLASPLKQSGMRVVATQPVSAAGVRVIEVPRSLPVGVAPERGLQVRTILVARSISAEFPEVQQIGGVRPDTLRWHPNGLALDVTVPNPGTAEGIALGDEIVEFALKNADRFGLQDAIWRGVYYTPGGPRGTGYGHFDHVHITTTGGGYPRGGEIYLR
jgi:hypothetical protein